MVYGGAIVKDVNVKRRAKRRPEYSMMQMSDSAVIYHWQPQLKPFTASVIAARIVLYPSFKPMTH